MNSESPSVASSDGAAWRLASAGPTWGLRFLGFVYRFLPLQLGQYLIWGMIWGWFQHFNRPRASVVRAMERMGQARPYWAAYRVFLNYGFMLVERFYTYRGRITLQIEQGPAARASARVMEEASREPGPLVVLSGHCGAVEHTASVLEGLGRNVRAVAVRDHGAATLLSGVGDPSVRLGAGRTILADGSMKAGLTMLKALKKGDILAFKADRPLPGATDAEVLEVPWFGSPAILPLGPAKLICAAKARAVVISVFRTGRARYIALADHLDTSSRDPEAIVRQYAEIQERHLRSHPDQWFNFYPFWPEDEPVVNALPETVPPALRGAEPVFVSTLSAVLGIALIGYIAAIPGAQTLLVGWPALGLGGLFAAMGAALSMWAGASVDTKLRYNLRAMVATALSAVVGAGLVALLAAGPLTASLGALAVAAGCLGMLVAFLHVRSRIAGSWLLVLFAVISASM